MFGKTGLVPHFQSLFMGHVYKFDRYISSALKVFVNPDRTARSDPNSEKNSHNNRPEPSARGQNDKQRVKGNKPASHSLRHASRVMNCLKITVRFTYRLYDYTAPRQ